MKYLRRFVRKTTNCLLRYKGGYGFKFSFQKRLEGRKVNSVTVVAKRRQHHSHRFLKARKRLGYQLTSESQISLHVPNPIHFKWSHDALLIFG